MPDGTFNSQVLNSFDANSYGLGSTRSHPAAKLVMRLFNKDAVALEHPKLGHVKAIIATIGVKSIQLFKPYEGNVDRRNRDKGDNFSYINVGLGTFQKYSLRKIGIDTLGRVTDPQASEHLNQNKPPFKS